MQSTNKPTRTRMSLSRTRGGCRTCKQRRVKCDEAKPACQRCIRANRHCAGYADISTENSKPVKRKITYYVPDALSWKSGVAEDIEQEHALDCFYYWTRKRFPSELAEPYRQQDILYEPATRHAMIAMGVLHEIYRYKITGPPAASRRIMAMQHYGKAIRSLLSRYEGSSASSNSSNDKRMSISLLTCLLFVCLETSQGHHTSALYHLQSGFRLFQKVLNDEKQGLRDDLRASERILRMLFVRLMCQLTHFDLEDCARFLGLFIEFATYPKYFASLDQARECLVELLEKIFSRRQKWMSHGGPLAAPVPNNDPIGIDAPPLTRDKILDDELVEIDQWILAFNLYLSYGVPVSQICDSYILETCAFLLKFRLTIDRRSSIKSSQDSRMDLTHIVNLGDIFRDVSPSSTTTMAVDKSSSTCPLHGLFDTQQDATHEDVEFNSGKSLFPFLGVLCPLYVSSTYSQDAATRLKASDAVSKICHCGKGWDLSLTNYIASLLSPDSNNNGSASSIQSVFQNSLSFGQTLSMGTYKLLTALYLFQSL